MSDQKSDASLNLPPSRACFAGPRYQLGVRDPGSAPAPVRAADDGHDPDGD
ncbi:MAG: hypothetical protein ABSH29_09850 [Acidimicrobiales bacterium]|jgi:hypothetical protein